MEQQPLNDDWIQEYENIDKIFQKLYKEKIYYVPFLFIYCNKEKEIVKIKEEYFFLSTPNRIHSEEIKNEITKRSKEDNILYKLLSICQYDVLIEEVNDLIYYIKQPNKYNFFRPILETIPIIETRPILETKKTSEIKDIYFHSSIPVVHDINTLLFLFIEKEQKLQQTRKINYHKHRTKTIKQKP